MVSMRVQITILLAVVLSLINDSLSTEVVSPVGYEVLPQGESPSSRTQYAYAYNIWDPKSEAYIGKQESRDGDLFYGSYIIQNDGTAINYSVDPIQAPDKVQEIQVPVPLPLALSIVHYVAPQPSSQLPPPSVHQIQIGTPVAISLPPAILARASSESGVEAPRSHTSFTSPTHSYSYSY